MRKKSKILYVHHAGGYGGAPKSMGYIIKNLNLDLYHPVLLNISQGPINDFFSKEVGCELIIDSKFMRPFHGSYVVENSISIFLRNWIFLIPTVLKAISYLRKIKPDLIHLNSTCLFAFSIAAKILRIPVICHVREPIRPGLAGWPLRFFSKFSVNGFIGISKFDLASLGVIPKKCNSKVIYNFVEKFKIKKTFEPGLFRKKLGIADNDVVFLYLARFSKSNGWMQLIAMAEKVVEDYPQAKFVLAGATEDIHFNHSKNNIFIVPFEKEIDDYLIGSDIFVCPFVLPHFARGIIEAAAFSLPSLGNNIDGVNELINDNVTGFLYKNKSDFYEKAVRLIKNKDLRNKLGEKAYIKAQTDFNIYNNLKETYAFYDEVVEI